ncbi:MAG: CRISPR-associated ring nuclease Csm6 [Thermaurantiacus sp.]
MQRVLLITAGATPQVVTETVWALARRAEPWIPHQVLLATTAAGARLYERGDPARGTRALLGADGKLGELFRAIAPKNPGPQVRVCVPEHAGQQAEDLRTDAEVEQFAEMLLHQVAEITSDPETVLHMSLAGGRKTMSFLAGQVMSLLGRPQDVLSHVLVEPASLENPQSGFWWPGDGSPGSDKAKVLLHEVPFLRVRAWLEPERLLDFERGYAAAVMRANMMLSDELSLDLGARTVFAGAETIRLPPREAAFLALLLLAHQRGLSLEQVLALEENSGDRQRQIALGSDPDSAKDLWSWLLSAASGPEREREERTFDGFARNARQRFDYDVDIGQPASRLRRKLRDELSSLLAARILSPAAFASSIDPAHVQILCPAELADHPAKPPELEVAGATPSG